MLTPADRHRAHVERALFKAGLWDAALDKEDRGGDPVVEARRQTARAAIEDWQEAMRNVD